MGGNDREDKMSAINPEEMATAEKVLEKVRDKWLARDGVTAVDLGFKWSKGQITPRLSIRVHVARKKDRSELSPEELFPKQVEGVLVDIIEAKYAPQALVGVRPEAAVEGRGKRFDVIPIGVSVGCKYSTAGTLGAKVIDNQSNKEMILSNWHVLVGRLQAQAGHSIWQPGWIDGGTNEENTIAKLSRWVLGPFDAAVAELNGVRPVLTTTTEGKEIVDITSPRLGMSVWKSGRSTGHTAGFVDGVKMKVPLDYREAGNHVLEEVFRVIPTPGTGLGEISTGGDSGAVWVDEETGKAVGLHFAGEIGETPEHALAHDISQVIEKLDVRFPKQVVSDSKKPAGSAQPPDESKGSSSAKPRKSSIPSIKSKKPQPPKRPGSSTPKPGGGRTLVKPIRSTKPKERNSFRQLLLDLMRKLFRSE
jgi:hypothetical protein